MSEDKLYRDKAITKQIERLTFRLIDEDDPELGGTAVALKIGERYFLATAAHVISSKHRVCVHLKTKHFTFSDFARREYYPDDGPDVGFLEIPKEAVGRFQSAFLHGKYVMTSFDRNSILPVRVVGFPGEYMQLVGREQIGHNDVMETRKCAEYQILSETLPRSKFPESASGDESVLYCRYDKNLRVLRESPAIDVVPSETGLLTPPLQGMSGGGIWLEQESTEDEVWSSDSRLLALESGYYEGQRCIKGTSMLRWLDLVEECYPDLKQPIADIRKQ